MKKLMALLAAGLMATPACAALSIEEQALADACRLTQYDCRGVKPPYVRHTHFGDAFGVYGVFLGGRIVWISSELDPAVDDYAYSILVHETVHYLQERVGHVWQSTSLIEVCLKEEEAYRAQNAILVELKLGDRVRAYPYDSRCVLPPE